jgi:glycerol-3-phosphate cytidylyltransferase-like family protein
MKKPENIRYEAAVTFGRFNIPHSGHVELIQMMLDYGDEAHVYVSDGGSNNDWDLRVLMLTHLCRESKLDMNRVYFLKAKSPFEAVNQSVELSVWNEAVIVLGSDQMDMARKLSEVCDCPHIINRRSNSSTQMRFFLDAEEYYSDLVDLYEGDEYATVLAMILRKEERYREKSTEAARKAAYSAS